MDLRTFNNNIEAWFLARSPHEFPDGVDYVSHYRSLKSALAPVQKSVTAGADFTDNTSLTWHDESHIIKVIKQVSQLLSYDRAHVTAFEAFVLLVAIQIHDVKNIEGRDEHENRAIEIFSDLNITGLIDSILLKYISFVASCHAGSIMIGSRQEKDKISLLNDLFKGERTIRLRFIAALIRLADEYSDDSARAMSFLLKIGKIRTGSIIHQKHAECLASVDIEPNAGKIDFDYHLTVEDALKKFPKYNKSKTSYEDVYLLDEIFERTMKSHYETVYCMRYLRPYVSITKLNISIVIEHLRIQHQLKIAYELEEKGYPNDELTIFEIAGDKLRTEGGYWSGETLKEYLTENNFMHS